MTYSRRCENPECVQVIVRSGRGRPPKLCDDCKAAKVKVKKDA